MTLRCTGVIDEVGDMGYEWRRRSPTSCYSWKAVNLDLYISRDISCIKFWLADWSNLFSISDTTIHIGTDLVALWDDLFALASMYKIRETWNLVNIVQCALDFPS